RRDTDMRAGQPRQCASAILGLLLLAAAAPAQTAALSELQVFPPDVNLFSARGKQTLVVQAVHADGITRDVTAQARITPANAALVKVDRNVVLPVADGATELAVEFGGRTVKVPVKVKDAKAERPISFKLDVMPLSRAAGCTQAGGHGAARGKAGSRLSLFGFDPEGDPSRLTREFNGRRINLALPAESLLLEKATGKVPHTGGERFKDTSEFHATIVRWLEAKAPLDPPDVAKPVSVDLFPKNAVLDGKGATQQMVVRAKSSDGTEPDVTGLALFLSNNDTSGKISPSGLVTAGERGEAFVMARFATFTVGSQVIALPKGLKFEFPSVPEN